MNLRHAALSVALAGLVCTSSFAAETTLAEPTVQAPAAGAACGPGGTPVMPSTPMPGGRGAFPPPPFFGAMIGMPLPPMPMPGMEHDRAMHAFSLMPPPFLRDLDLSDEQVDKIFAVLHGRAPALRGLMQQQRSARESLEKMVIAGKFDQSQARTFAQAQAKAQADADFLRVKTDSEIVALLTADQRKAIDRDETTPAPAPHP